MIYIIVGPTGSGKTEVAIKLSNFLGCVPIINADAFQIYKDMNIGTAKVDIDSTLYKRHYLLDIRTPDQSFSVKEYQDIFRATINKLLEEYQDVIVCGGTGLYIRASIYDYSFEETSNDDTSDLEALSNDELWNLLLKLDKGATQTIHKNNRKRVIRAISIARTAKHNKTENIQEQRHELIYPKEQIKIFNINLPREEIYERINARVDKMIEKGLVDEVKNLRKKYKLSQTATQGIGYKEIISYLDNEISLDRAIELIKQRSRNYAKRQITYFKHQLDTINIQNFDDILKEIENG